MAFKTIKHPSAENEWKDHFRNHALKVGFSLHLTKTMIDFLCAVADDVRWDRSLYRTSIPDNWIATEEALTKRGLIERKSQEWFAAHKYDNAPFCSQECCVLTPAGRLVVDLLKAAGIFVEADAAINKRHGKKA